MVRILPSVIAVAGLLPSLAWAQTDRYGPDQAPRLRGADLPASTRLLAWSSRDHRLKAPSAPAPEAPAAPPAAALPSSIYDPAPAPIAEAPPAPPPRHATVRRYSVGREFGVPPDPIPLPAPSVLAYSAEVGQAVLAQQERERAAADLGPMSPADLDMLERQEQAVEREADRERARERARQLK